MYNAFLIFSFHFNLYIIYKVIDLPYNFVTVQDDKTKGGFLMIRVTEKGIAVVRSTKGEKFELNSFDFNKLLGIGASVGEGTERKIFDMFIKRIMQRKLEIEDIGLIPLMVYAYQSERGENNPIETIDKILDGYLSTSFICKKKK